MSREERKAMLRQHLFLFHPVLRVSHKTLAYMDRAHDADHRRNPHLNDDPSHILSHDLGATV